MFVRHVGMVCWHQTWDKTLIYLHVPEQKINQPSDQTPLNLSEAQEVLCFSRHFGR